MHLSQLPPKALTPQTINIEIWGLKSLQMNFGSHSSDLGGGDDHNNEDTFNKHNVDSTTLRDQQHSDSVRMAESGKLCPVQIWRKQPQGSSMARRQPYALPLGSQQGCTGHCDSHDRCLVAACILSGPPALHTADCWVCFFFFFFLLSHLENTYTGFYNV